MSSVDPTAIRTSNSGRSADIPLSSQGSGYDAAFEARVLAITRKYFPGPYEIEETFDPQEPEHRWRVIVVNTHAAVHEILALEEAWREQIHHECGPENALKYTLFVLPQAS